MRIVGLRRIGKTVSVPKAFVLPDNDVVLRLALILSGLGFASVSAVDAANEECGVGRIITYGACTVKKE